MMLAMIDEQIQATDYWFNPYGADEGGIYITGTLEKPWEEPWVD
jgi:hypothetical protein